MLYNKNTGISLIIVAFIVMALCLIVAGVLMNTNKTKSIERSLAVEYNIRTYYVALAGINECIATRMAPRSNVLSNNYNVTTSQLARFNRVDNSGFIYSNPYSKKKSDIIGRYIYVSHIITKNSDGKYVINESNVDDESERYLVYSKGTTTLPDGSEDSVVIKAIFDLNRYDNDFFNADEVEKKEILNVNSPEAKYAEGLMKIAMSDKTPPDVKEVKFRTLGGAEISLDVANSSEDIEVENVSVRSKIDIIFSEPVEGSFLDGIQIKNITTGQTLKDVEKVLLSPKNLDIVILPAEKSGGRILDYASKYILEITDVADYNGNIQETTTEIMINSEPQPSSGIETPQMSASSQRGETGEDTGQSEDNSSGSSDPFGLSANSGKNSSANSSSQNSTSSNSANTGTSSSRK